MSKTKIISVINQKGGVGKTTTTANLAYALGKNGYKILAVDFDQQASLTNYLNYGLDGENYYSVYELLLKIFREIDPEEDTYLAETSLEELIDDIIVRPTYITRKMIEENGKKKVVDVQEEFGFDLLPSSIELADFELELSQSSEFRKKAYYLNALIKKIIACKEYDYILIDCNPSLGVLTINAVIAGIDGTIIPTNLDLMSTRGIKSLIGKIADIQKVLYRATNGELLHKGILGIVLNLYSDRRAVDRVLSVDIDEFYPLHVFKTRIPDSAMAKRAVLEGVTYSQKSGKAEKAYDSLAKEFMRRIEKLEKEKQKNVYYFDAVQSRIISENLETGEVKYLETAKDAELKGE